MTFDVETRLVDNGRYKVHVIRDDLYIGRTIAAGYEWDGWMRRDIVGHYKPNTDILDIGANIGVSSIYALSVGRRCWLFEPISELHESELGSRTIVVKKAETRF